MASVDFKNVGFIYKFWYDVFCFIENVLFFSVLRKYFFKNTKNFSDKWVVFNLLCSFFTLIFVNYGWLKGLNIILLGYSGVRVFEIVIYQINILLFHPYKTLVIRKKKEYKIQNPYRSVVLLGHNLLEVLFWFTAMTIYLNPSSDRLLFKLIDNTIRIFTLNYEKVASDGELLQLVFFLEVLFGLILTLISVAKFIGELPHIHIVCPNEKNGKFHKRKRMS